MTIMPASDYNPAAHQTSLFGTDLLLHLSINYSDILEFVTLTLSLSD